MLDQGSGADANVSMTVAVFAGLFGLFQDDAIVEAI